MTRLGAYVGEAFAAIWRNRTRSVLTMLGMIIGTASIISVLGISKAASGGITGTLDSLGDQGISVHVDANQDDPNAAAIQYRDLRSIQAATEGLLTHIEPSYQRSYPVRAGAVKVGTTVISTSDFYRDSLVMTAGRRFSADDVASAAHVCLLTEDLATHLFPTGAALGQSLSVSGTRCSVVGIYAEIKGGLFASAGGNELLFLPYTTLHELSPGPVDSLTMYVAPGVDEERAEAAVLTELHSLHGTRAQYIIGDQNAQIQTFNTVLNVVSDGLTAIGGVALLVAGIGIMNIMLVSVTERTREIGLRKAIGASRRDIVLQFLLEAILLSFMGGGAGTVIGFVATVIAYGFVEKLVGPAPIPYLLIMSVSVGFSTLVGCVFGTYPAIRASRLDPIMALRS